MKLRRAMACAVAVAVFLSSPAADRLFACALGDVVPPSLPRGVSEPVPADAATALADRRAKLDKLAADAWLVARRRARLLYRVIRARDAALSTNDVPAEIGSRHEGDRARSGSTPAAAVSVGLTALARDLEEARALAAEAARVDGRSEGEPHPSAKRAVVAAGGAPCLWPAGARRLEGADDDTFRLPAQAARALRAPMDGVFEGLPRDPDGRPLSALTAADGWTFLFVGPRVATSHSVAVKRGERLPWALERDDGEVEIELWHGARQADPQRACLRGGRL